MTQAKQDSYDVGVKGTEDTLTAQVTKIYQGYYLRVWIEALNLAGVDASLELRKPKIVFYPPASRIESNPTSVENAIPTSLPANQPVDATATSSEPTRKGEVERSNPPLETNT